MYEGAPDVAFLSPWLTEDAPGADDEWRGHCPMPDHEDDNPSASFNFVKYEWFCLGCKAGGSIGKLINDLQNDGYDGPRTVEAAGDNGGFEADIIDLKTGKRRTRRRQPLPNVGRVEGWHSQLLSSHELMNDLLTERGLNDSTVKNYTLGYDRDSGSYTIPFTDADGRLVNVKHYRLHREGDQKKMWSYTGHNSARMYPGLPEPEDEHVLLCEGEMDTLLAIQHGLNAMTSSGGSKTWDAEWTKHFKDKRVTICYDKDKAGKEGTRKVIKALTGVAEEIRVIDLPMEYRKENGYDLTDFWKQNKDTFKEELAELLKNAERVYGKPKPEEEARPIRIIDSQNIRLAGELLQLRAQVVARTGSTGSYPSKVEVRCTGDAKELCNGCPMQTIGEGIGSGSWRRAEIDITPGHPAIVDIASKRRKGLKDIIVDRWGLHCKKKVLEPEELEHDNFQIYGVRKAVDDGDYGERGNDVRDLTGIRRVIVSPNFEGMPNTVVKLTGTVVRDKATNANEFLVWDMSETEADIDKFQMTPELHERLKVFQAEDERRPLNKLKDIAEDLADNVTGIRGRTDLHVAMDLVWHSVLSFRFRDKVLRKGWLELMVAGDTRTGKSEVAYTLARHYRSGRIVSGEAATFAGLVGGSQKANEEWAVTWGAMPMNDRRLVAIDEVSGLSHEKIGQMSSVRSSGVAQIHHINTSEADARCRLIWMGNPRDDRAVKEIGSGIVVVEHLIGAPEDIARLDFAMLVTQDDVSNEVMNAPNLHKRPHVYTSELCRNLVAWVWSRGRNDVVWDKGAEQEVINKAVELSRRFVSSPPLIQGANVREKVARIAVAIAARTYSTDDGQHVKVTKWHVRAAAKLLTRLYSGPFGYDERSRDIHERERLARQHRTEAYNDLMGNERLEQFFKTVCSGDRRFIPRILETQLGEDHTEANALIRQYLGWGMIVVDDHTRNVYRVTPELVDIIQELRKGQKA